jgi:hypothetical protein
MMEQYGDVTSEAPFDLAAEWIGWYHGVAQPGTAFCVDYLGIPPLIAPIISMSVIIFCPLYFLGMLVFGPNGLGFTGKARYCLPPTYSPACRD